jgi:magnesium chelatase family protein
LAQEVSVRSNGNLNLQEAEQVTQLGNKGRHLIQEATKRLGLSARAYLRILRVARSIADLEDTEHVSEAQLGEAIQGRLLDRESGF